MSHAVTRRLAGAVRPVMSASLVIPSMQSRPAVRRRSPWWLLLAGPAGGAALGALSRGWMRMIADDPEFTWSGTVFIVVAFTVAGLGHGVARATRATGRRRWGTVARGVGAVLTLPLFVGAGALMLPTVVAASLARWRTDWPRWARAVAVAIALPAPVGVVVGTWRDGPTVSRAAGLVLFVLTYVAIVAGLRAVVAPAADGRRMRRSTRVAVVVAVVVLLLVVASFAVGVATA